MRLLRNLAEKRLPISLGLLFVIITTSLLFISAQPINSWLDTLENLSYDLQLRQTFKPLPSKGIPITIIDIDDKSLAAVGRWPWSRGKLAELVSKLHTLGATVIAFDVTFPDQERNLAEELIQGLETKKNENSEFLQNLERVKPDFDYDALFARSLASGDAVLATVFTDEGHSQGALPSPLVILTPELAEQLAIPMKQSYLGNIEVLATAAKTAGFINATPDRDGVMRFSPLLFRYELGVYGSLALQATNLYLLTHQVDLMTASYGNTQVLEGIKLDQVMIPTDPSGRILIPFRGAPFSFPYVSAIDILNDSAPADAITNKLIFIGSTASALGDTRATAMAPIFPGVEVQASIALGVLEHYFPYKPAWGRGATAILMVLLGLAMALLLPHVGVLLNCIICFLVPLALILINRWFWLEYGIVISLALPVILIFSLFVLNAVYGYVFESRKRKELKSTFGQYISPERLDMMMEEKEDIGLEGQSKELSVLFADIRNFTNASEKLSPKELKTFLNLYLTPMTQVIFDHKGTIDKYVGDMIMAFWGAPLEDPLHALHAVTAAMNMQTKLAEFNQASSELQRPEIKIGIGVNTGIMSVGDMGSNFRRAYTVLGDAVNLGSRLEGLSKQYHVDILVGKNTQLQTKNAIIYKKIDNVKVKGKDQAVEIFQPLCLADQATKELLLKVDMHHQALDAYFAQHWELAESLFKKLQASDPQNEALYTVYLQRLEKLRSSPPGSTWDGAFVAETK